MSNNFQFELVSPEKLLMSGEVTEVVIPGSEGDFAILAGHAPVVSTIRPGTLEINTAAGEKKSYFVHGGFVEAGPTSLTVIAEFAVPVEEMTDTRIDQDLKHAREHLDHVLAHQKGDDAAAKEAHDMIDCLTRMKGAA